MKTTLALLALLFTFSTFSQTPGIKSTKYLNISSGFSDYNTYIFDSKPTVDGGFILAGIDTGFTYIQSEFLNKSPGGRAWIAKVDSKGNKVWQANPTPFINPHNGGFLSVCNPSPGLYVAAGFAQDEFSVNNSQDFFIAGYNSAGVSQWENFYRGSGQFNNSE